jgi:predicted alpha/beta hydrolase family esterase
MAKQSVYFVHGAGDPRQPLGSGHLSDYLQQELGDAYELIAPTMPQPDEPHYEPWRDRIAADLARIADEPTLVGHSFGGSVLLKSLAEGVYQAPINGLFLVAVPYWGPDFPEYALPDDFADRLPPTPIVLYHSRDDPEAPFSHLRRYQEHLPVATSRAIDGAEHSFTRGLPQLVEDIRSLTVGSSR